MSTKDHPRSRGVYWTVCWNRATRVGSSPLARGLLYTSVSTGTVCGIIPARAGFTMRYKPAHASAPDHPRSRGVYARSIRSTGSTLGSSPLARGLLRGADENRPVPRDHPRSRGVYCGAVSRIEVLVGSSPLARGLLGVRPPEPHLTRIIPARAGFTPR